MSKQVSRRGFMGMAGAGLTAAAAGHLWTARRALASPTAPLVKRLLILHAGGGARTTCLFNAHVGPRHNPFGSVSSDDVDSTGAPLLAASAEWGVGRVLLGLGLGQSPTTLRPQTLATWQGATLPYLSQVADKITVLASVDHDPTLPQGDVDHVSATARMCTGAPDGQLGLLTLLGKQISAMGTVPPALPPVIVGGSGPAGASVYGVADPSNAPYRPIFIDAPGALPSLAPPSGTPDPAWATSLESQIDGDFIKARSAALDGRGALYVAAKGSVAQYGALLAADALRVSSVDAALGTLTNGMVLSNAMLAELFGIAAPGDMTDPDTLDTHWGGPTALAVRLLQSGAPAVAVGVGGWDLHSGEASSLPRLAGSLGRSMAALYFLFSQLQDDSTPGRTWWDTTLVVFTSEFCRDGAADHTDEIATVGFNGALGSDHHGTPPCRYQALPLMGGPVQGGRLLSPTDEDLKPVGAPIASASLLATLTQALGVDPGDHFAYPPLAEVWG